MSTPTDKYEAVDTNMLRRVAQKYDVPRAESHNKEELIRLLRATSALEMSPTRWELEKLDERVVKAEQKLSAAQKNRETLAELGEKIDEGGDAIEGVKERVNQLSERVAGLAVLRNIFSIIGGALALIAVVGGLFGIRAQCNIEAQEKKVTSLQQTAREQIKAVSQNAQKLSAIRDIHMQYLLRRFRLETEEVLNTFNLNLLDRQTIADLEEKQTALRQLLMVKGGNREQANMLHLLDAVHLALLRFERVSKMQGNERIQPLNEASRAWRKVVDVHCTQFAFKRPAYAEFAAWCPVWGRNVLAIIALKRFDITRNQNLLVRAEQYLREATRLNAEFGRVYSNFGIVNSWRFKASFDKIKGTPAARKRKTIAGLQSLLNKMISSYNTALDYETDSYNRSIVYNNIANYYIRKSDLLLLQRDRKEALTALVRGLKALDLADAIANRDPLVLETRAEVLSAMIPLRGRELPRGSAAARRYADRIYNLLKKATVEGLSDFRALNHNIDKILKQYKEFANLKRIDPDFRTNFKRAIGG